MRCSMIFDAPDGNATTARRNTTTTAPQALFLVNGEWALARAEAFAARLESAHPASNQHEDRIALAFRLALRAHALGPRRLPKPIAVSRPSRHARVEWHPIEPMRGRPRCARRLLSCAVQFK